MKYILILLFPLVTSAQIEVKPSSTKFTVGKIKTVELYGLIIDKDTSYVIMYYSAKYKTITDIRSISFKDNDSTIENLYKTLSSFFTDENRDNKEYKVEFKLGETNVIVSNMKPSIMFWTPEGYFFLTEKQLKNLFGK